MYTVSVHNQSQSQASVMNRMLNLALIIHYFQAQVPILRPQNCVLVSP